MPTSRARLLTVACLLAGAPLLATAGYGIYIRSGWYRRWVANQASTFLEAPVTIDAVQPIDFTSRGFRRITARLPATGQVIFQCDLAIWRRLNEHQFELDLRRGVINIVSDRWSRREVHNLVKTTIAHEFQQVKLARVRLSGIDFMWQHGPVRLSLGSAAGIVEFDDQDARATIVCDALNGIEAAGPITIRAKFRPGKPPLLHEVILEIPRISVAALLPAANLARADQATVPQGVDPTKCGFFAGRITYRQKQPGEMAGTIQASGRIDGVDLAYIGPLLDEPDLKGRISGNLRELTVDSGRLARLSASLHAEGVDLAPLCKALNLPPTGGQADLHLETLEYQSGSLKSLLASATISNLDLSNVLKFLNAGTITGTINARLSRLKVVDNSLDELEGTIVATPPPDRPGTIDRTILEAALWQMLKVPLPPVLPSKIEYIELGCRLRGDKDRIYILGITGPARKFLMTANLHGVPVPLIPQPPMPVQLSHLKRQTAPALTRLLAMGADWLGSRQLHGKTKD